jgi:hypothetical protein
MDDRQYRAHCLGLLHNFAELMGRESAKASPDDPIRELAAGFEAIASGEGLYERGPGLIALLFTSCPHLAPVFPRELLWFLGGDCLHYLSDTELEAFQILDEKRLEAAASGELLDYHSEKAKLLKLQ